MRRFITGEIKVLVTTAIIENGLDVPNANTLIVDRADQFGLRAALPAPRPRGTVAPPGVLLPHRAAGHHR